MIDTKEQRIIEIFIKQDLGFIENYCNESALNLEYALTRGFEYSIYGNAIETVNFLLTSDKISKNADIHHNDHYAINIASFRGSLDLIKYLLTSPKLKQHSDFHNQDENPFRYAAEANHLHVVKYFLEEYKPNLNINIASRFTKNNAFMMACDQNALSVISYLAKREDLDIETALYHLNLDNKDGFMLACENHEQDTAIIDFIVFEMGFTPREYHQNYFEENSNHKQIMYAKKIIEIRNLNENLNTSLEVKKTINKNKI